jgi:hypothetical protein
MVEAPHARASKDGAEAAIRAIHRQMIEAWNRGSAEGFAAAFTDEADFIAFEGTHLVGHSRIVAFHRQIFDTWSRPFSSGPLPQDDGGSAAASRRYDRMNFSPRDAVESPIVC